jgi:hypothetical protein
MQHLICPIHSGCSASNGSRSPASGPGLNRKNGSVRFQNRPKTRLGGPNPYPYASTRGFCRVWLDPSVPVSGSPFRVVLFMVTVTYVTVMCKISTLVHHSVYLFHWWPLYSKQGETCTLLRAEVECDQLFILHDL